MALFLLLILSLGVMIATIFHSNRLGMINRCLNDARDVDKSLSESIQSIKMLTESAGSVIAGSSDTETNSNLKFSAPITASLLKGESLASNLCVGRHYVDRNIIPSDQLGNETDSKRRRVAEYHYDPRFLLFEFTW
jgi:hypothetical protein